MINTLIGLMSQETFTNSHNLRWFNIQKQSIMDYDLLVLVFKLSPDYKANGLFCVERP